MNILKGIVTELRERRLWPVAVLLLVGLVAVPVLLTKSPASTPSSQAQGTTLPGTSGHTLTVKLAAGTEQSGLHGPGHDPFIQGGATSTTSTTTARTAATTATSASTSAGSSSSTSAGSGSSTSAGSGSSTSSTSSSSTSSGGSSSSTTTTLPTIPPPAHPAKPAPTGLGATQSYAVSLEITNGSGGVQPIDPVERLSPIPSISQPLLVELGVAQGGRRVLFAVQPGTLVQNSNVGGNGSCTPGPVDCEILSVPVGAIENFGTQSGGLTGEFLVTAITAVNHSSVAAANRARNTESSVGAQLLSSSSLTALSLFQYEPSVGAVVDLRNLTVGGI